MDTYFKDWETTTIPMVSVNDYFNANVKGRERDMFVTPILKHLRHLNKYKGMSKPSKKDLEKLKYRNKAFVMDGDDFLELSGKEFPSKNDLINQKVYLHVRDTCTNSMLMSKDFDIQPQHLNVLINEVISMNPHLVRDWNVDYYTQRIDNPNGQSQLGLSVKDVSDGRSHLRPSVETPEYSESAVQYYTIKEALYASIVSSMSKSKDVLTSFKRNRVGREYVEAFINLKEHLSDAGYSSQDIKDAMAKRQVNTKLLKLAMYKLLGDERGVLSRHEASLFNHINHKLEIHAIKKDKDNNRNAKNTHLQVLLVWVELCVLKVIEVSDNLNVDPLLITGVCISYLNELNLTHKTNIPPKQFIEELMKEDNVIEGLQKLINTNPYKTIPITREVNSFIKAR